MVAFPPLITRPVFPDSTRGTSPPAPLQYGPFIRSAAGWPACPRTLLTCRTGHDRQGRLPVGAVMSDGPRATDGLRAPRRREMVTVSASRWGASEPGMKLIVQR